jgi:ASC-1-like (ASCH) protein
MGIIMKFLTSILILSALIIPELSIAADTNSVSPEVSIGSSGLPSTPIELFVNEPWLSSIRDGMKTVEGRAGPLIEFSGWVGKKAKFYSKEQELIINVLEVHHYATLNDYLNAEGWQNAAPHLSSFEETVNAYLQFYPEDYIRDHGGMNGIIVSVQR